MQKKEGNFMANYFAPAKGRSAFLVLLIALMAVCMIFSATTGVSAKVTVEKGPNSSSSAVIYENKATAEGDYTVSNGVIAFTIAGESNNYWGMTKGSILDLAYVNPDLTSGYINLTNDIEFLNDYWTATGGSLDCTIDTSKSTDDKAVIEVTTAYENGTAAKPLEVVITYTLEDGKDYIGLSATSSNPADNDATYANMHSGFSITTLAASMFGPFGYYPDVKVTGIGVGADPAVNQAYGDFVVSYSKTYAVTLFVKDADCYKGSSGYKDLYKTYDIAPGESYSYEGEVFVSPESETATYLQHAYERDSVAADAHSVISGKVTDAKGDALEGAYVIAEAKGAYKTVATANENADKKGEVVENLQPFVWDIVDADGAYSLDLPNGEYTIKVEAEGYTFAEEAINLTAAAEKDFALENGAPIKLTAVDETGAKVPFKVSVAGVTTEMKTLGGAVQFSDAVSAKDPYTIEFTMPKADEVTFTASYGSDFESKAATYTTAVTDKGVEYEFKIPTVIDPQKDGWYCADNHQHSKFGDGATEPIDLYRAQVANKLDFSIVSDHDSRLYDMEIAGYAATGGIKIPFIPSLEVSPGWGHWGMLNIDYATSPEQQADVNYTGNIVNPSATTPQEIITQGHHHGATVVANHPYTDYGFLNNQASLPTGNDEGWDLFDLVELQSTIDLSAMEQALNEEQWEKVDMSNLGATVKSLGYDNIDVKALISAMAFWNQGDKKYLSGGSDQHDAHSTTLYPGKVREYALLGEDYSVDHYIDVLREGKAFVTTGPILIPADENMYGSSVRAADGEKVTVKLSATAVNGLSEVTLWQNGIPVDQKTFDAVEDTQAVEFEVTVDALAKNQWVSFTAADANGGYAATNPIWVKATSYEDVKADSYYESPVAWAVKKGITNGTSDTTFSPVKACTRGEIVTFLYRAAGSPAVEGAENPFTDVQEGKFYYDAVLWAVDKGITNGMTATTFEPNTTCNRGQIVTFLYRYAGSPEIAEGTTCNFTDVQEGKFYYDAVLWAVANKITKGTSETTFAPADNCNRAQAVTFLYRLD